MNNKSQNLAYILTCILKGKNYAACKEQSHASKNLLLDTRRRKSRHHRRHNRIATGNQKSTDCHNYIVKGNRKYIQKGNSNQT